MNWNPMNHFYKDFSLEIMLREKENPLYGFLSFLMVHGEDHGLNVKVTKQAGKNKIREMFFQFNDESDLIIPMKDLTLMGYADWCQNPVRLIETLEEWKPLLIARNQYDRAKYKLENNELLLNRLDGKNVFGYDVHLLTAKEDLLEQQKIMTDAIRQGALFSERMTDLYRTYEKHLKKPNSAPTSTPVSDMPIPEGDHIEVELQTILNDPDISGRTKADAHATLESYRNAKVKEVEQVNPKEENALLAIRTIQKHYLDTKTESERGREE